MAWERLKFNSAHKCKHLLSSYQSSLCYLSSGLWGGGSAGDKAQEPGELSPGDLETRHSYPMYVQATALLDCLLFPGLRKEAASVHPQALRAQPLGLPGPGAVFSPNA